MNFDELENLMAERGISSLAEIARKLDTTPQAVSNWKARNQVPFHIVDKDGKELYVPKGKVWISLVPSTKLPSFG